MNIRQVSKSQAIEVLKLAGFSPDKTWSTPELIVQAGTPFCYETENGNALCVVKKSQHRLWITGAAAYPSKGITQSGLPIAEKLAIDSGLKSVAFQTRRKGLVKLAEKQGFKVVGYILEKVVA